MPFVGVERFAQPPLDTAAVAEIAVILAHHDWHPSPVISGYETVETPAASRQQSALGVAHPIHYRVDSFRAIAQVAAAILTDDSAAGARQGILFKSGAQLELIGKVKAIAFDKTGTLTTGKPQVYTVIAAEGYTEANVVYIAAELEVYSEHPIGQAICQYATNGLPTADASVTSVQAQPGQGITGLRGGIPVCVGKAAFVQSSVQTLPMDLLTDTNQLEQEGKTVVWIAEAGSVVGLIAIADTIRPEATAAISQLKRMGIEAIVMLTGDNQQTAWRDRLGLTRFMQNCYQRRNFKLFKNYSSIIKPLQWWEMALMTHLH